MSIVTQYSAADILRRKQWARGRDWYMLLGFLCREPPKPEPEPKDPTEPTVKIDHKRGTMTWTVSA